MVDRNSFDLTGRVALITGGGYGIGRSIGEMMADFGADVAIADIREELAKETATLLGRFGHRTLAIKADVSNNADVENMVRTTVEKLGAVDILVNNAGMLVGNAPIHETTEEVWDRIMAVNLKGVFLCTRATLPVMIKQKKGSIINIASVGAILPGDRRLGSVTYDVSKGAVITFYEKDGSRVRKRWDSHQCHRARNNNGNRFCGRTKSHEDSRRERRVSQNDGTADRAHGPRTIRRQRLTSSRDRGLPRLQSSSYTDRSCLSHGCWSIEDRPTMSGGCPGGPEEPQRLAGPDDDRCRGGTRKSGPGLAGASPGGFPQKRGAA